MIICTCTCTQHWMIICTRTCTYNQHGIIMCTCKCACILHFALADYMQLVCQHQPSTPISALQAMDLLSVTCPSHAPAVMLLSCSSSSKYCVILSCSCCCWRSSFDARCSSSYKHCVILLILELYIVPLKLLLLLVILGRSSSSKYHLSFLVRHCCMN